MTNRYQIVSVNGYRSRPFEATSGVAQGSRLGPLLFDIYINDIFSVVQYSKIDLFADDCRLYLKVKNQSDALKLQVEKITFARKNDTVKFHYMIAGSTMKEVKKVRDLGVMLDHK